MTAPKATRTMTARQLREELRHFVDEPNMLKGDTYRTSYLQCTDFKLAA